MTCSLATHVSRNVTVTSSGSTATRKFVMAVVIPGEEANSPYAQKCESSSWILKHLQEVFKVHTEAATTTEETLGET